MINAATSAAGAASTTSAATLGPGGKMGKDEFLKILVAQLRHQDPLNPMQGNEMAVQLAQFSSVEQLMNLNQSFEGQASLQTAIAQALNGTTAVGMIGRDVRAVGEQVTVQNGVATVDAVVERAGRGVLRVYDANGRELAVRELGSVPGGAQSFRLDGLPDGTYRAELSVRDENDVEVGAQMFVTARIEGVRYTAEGPVLTAGGLEIPFGAVVEVVSGQ